jgi:hypothetical protein
VIVRLTSEEIKVVVDVCPPDGDIYQLFKIALGGLVSYFSFRGSLLFHLHQVT